jgi:hypothetical protein
VTAAPFPTLSAPAELPPILLGNVTPQTQARTEQFYWSVAEMFNAWVQRCTSPPTQRAYAQDVMAFSSTSPGHQKQHFAAAPLRSDLDRLGPERCRLPSTEEPRKAYQGIDRGEV